VGFKDEDDMASDLADATASQQSIVAFVTAKRRLAYVKTTPGLTNIVAVYLDTDGAGEEVNVICNIIGGSYLNAAQPMLQDGDPIIVVNIAGTWYCTNLFLDTDLIENGGFDSDTEWTKAGTCQPTISGGKLNWTSTGIGAYGTAYQTFNLIKNKNYVVRFTVSDSTFGMEGFENSYFEVAIGGEKLIVPGSSPSSTYFQDDGVYEIEIADATYTSYTIAFTFYDNDGLAPTCKIDDVVVAEARSQK